MIVVIHMLDGVCIAQSLQNVVFYVGFKLYIHIHVLFFEFWYCFFPMFIFDLCLHLEYPIVSLSWVISLGRRRKKSSWAFFVVTVTCSLIWSWVKTMKIFILAMSLWQVKFDYYWYSLSESSSLLLNYKSCKRVEMPLTVRPQTSIFRYC